MDDRLLDALLERSRDQADGLRLTGEGSMLCELVRAVLERALESELTAHLGYSKGGRGGGGGGRGPQGGRRKTDHTAGAAGRATATPATGTSPRRSRPGSGRCRCRCPGTGRGRSSRSWSPSGPGGLDDMVISLYVHGMS